MLFYFFHIIPILLITISIPLDVNYADDKVLLKKRNVTSALSTFSSKAVKQNNKNVFKNERSLE